MCNRVRQTSFNYFFRSSFFLCSRYNCVARVVFFVINKNWIEIKRKNKMCQSNRVSEWMNVWMNDVNAYFSHSVMLQHVWTMKFGHSVRHTYTHTHAGERERKSKDSVCVAISIEMKLNKKAKTMGFPVDTAI